MKFELVNNLIVVDATMNGSTVPMILDTGAAATIISQDVAQELDLKKAEVTCEGMGAGGNVEFSSVEIESLVVDSVTHHALTGMTMDMAEICKRIDYEVGGIIGHNFLSSAKLTIDYTTQNILLEEPQDSENSTRQ